VSSYEALKAGGYFTPWNGGNPKYGLHDEVMKRVVLRIAKKHPLKMLYLYAFKKPKAIWQVSRNLVLGSETALTWLILAGGLVAGFLWIGFGSRRELLEAVGMVLTGAGAAIIAVLPCVWAYAMPWSVIDGLLVTFAMTVLVVGISVWALWSVFSRIMSMIRNSAS